MTGPNELWQQAADTFQSHHDAITDDQWDAATPCTEWTVKDLVEHAVGVQTMLAAGLAGVQADGSDWGAARAAMETAFTNPEAMEGTVAALGDMPKHQAAGLAVGDLLIHTWDLARALGRDDTLPPAAVEAVSMGLHNMPAEFMRAPGRFAAEVALPDGASAQDQLIAFAGRRP